MGWSIALAEEQLGQVSGLERSRVSSFQLARDALAAGLNLGDFFDRYEHTIGHLQWVDDIQEDLVYGSEVRGVRASASTSNEITRVFFGDACAELRRWGLGPDAGRALSTHTPSCASFYNGILLSGAQVAFKQYLQLARGKLNVKRQ